MGIADDIQRNEANNVALNELYKKGLEIYRSSGPTAEVARLMQLAGDGGNGQAWAFLGYQYQEGVGVTANSVVAVDCYLKISCIEMWVRPLQSWCSV